MFIIYLLLFLFLFSLVSVLRLIFRVRSEFRSTSHAKNYDEKKEGDVTLFTDVAPRRKIDPSLGEYVDYKETKK